VKFRQPRNDEIRPLFYLHQRLESEMANMKIVGALALSAAFAMATPAMAQKFGGGGGFHGGGGGGFHGGGGMHAGGFGGGMHAGGPGGGFRAAAIGGGGGMPRAAIANNSFRNANASMGAVPSAGSGAVVANGGRNWNGSWNGGWRHHGYRPGIGFVAGLAAGSALGYGYGGYYDGYYADNGYYGDNYAYNDGYYDAGDPGYVVSSPGYVVSSNDDGASCAQRYRSYDPASGTYLGYDGLRHPCP
jgi:hypothetical protein